MKKSNGFSLVEILIVLSIAIVLVLIGIPTTRQLIPSFELTSSTREIASQLRYAAQQAVTEQVNYLVKFDTVNDQYSLYRIPDPGQPEVEEYIETKDLANSVDFQSITGLTDNEVRFNSAGAPSDSGQIVLENSQAKTKTVDIRPSGYVKTD
ncbi:GspH/FimT family pseudopilin [Patescibacteria group bacterium]|nr:GspH/FimT family pseudopilin [Patescibacteria group bacterium]